MMTEKGLIREINGRRISLAPDMSAACFGCMNSECKKTGFISAENPLKLPLAIGQTVEVEAQGISIFLQALVILLPPIISFITGYALINSFFPKAGEGAAIGAAFIFLFAAAFIVYRIRKSKPARWEYVVSRIIAE
jgi:positive regulator of sigma E activity